MLFRLTSLIVVLFFSCGVNAVADTAKDYQKMCAACHNAGVVGAPKFGDKEAWAPRIAKGNKTLYRNAIKGFTGKKGVMPPKGGFVNLSDSRIKAIVEYMIARAQ